MLKILKCFFIGLKISREKIQSSKEETREYLYKEASVNKEISLNTILSNLLPENEKFLREILLKKAEKGSIYSKNGTMTHYDIGFDVFS